MDRENRSGVKSHIKQVAARTTFTHCVLHRYALVVKTLAPNLTKRFIHLLKLLITLDVMP